jgi:hypothetical protein
VYEDYLSSYEQLLEKAFKDAFPTDKASANNGIRKI